MTIQDGYQVAKDVFTFLHFVYQEVYLWNTNYLGILEEESVKYWHCHGYSI